MLETCLSGTLILWYAAISTEIA